MTSGDVQLALGLLDLASCLTLQFKWGLTHRRSTVKMCLMKVIERKRERKKGQVAIKVIEGLGWGVGGGLIGHIISKPVRLS